MRVASRPFLIRECQGPNFDIIVLHCRGARWLLLALSHLAQLDVN